MPLYRNDTDRAVFVDLAGPGAVVEHAPTTMSTIIPGEIVAGGFHLNSHPNLTKLVGAETLGSVIASQVATVPFGRLILISGTTRYEFSRFCHLIDVASMLATNFELFGQAIDCSIKDITANHEFHYQAKVIPNTLTIV